MVFLLGLEIWLVFKIFIIVIENNKRSSKYLLVRLYIVKCVLYLMYLKFIFLKSDCN